MHRDDDMVTEFVETLERLCLENQYLKLALQNHWTASGSWKVEMRRYCHEILLPSRPAFGETVQAVSPDTLVQCAPIFGDLLKVLERFRGSTDSLVEAESQPLPPVE